jgi:glycosyltransferase involved in cell wall biosynthesis
VSYRKKVIYEMHEFPEVLSLRGHEITFLEFDEARKFWQAKQAPKRATISGRVHSQAKVDLNRPFQLGIPGLDRLLAALTVIPTLNSLLRRGCFDAVVLYAVPTYGLQTLWLAKKHDVPVVFRALDVSHKIRSSFLSPAIKWVERLLYKQVDLLSANNPAMADYCQELGKRTKATLVHYPPLDLTHFQNAKSDQSLRRSLGLSDTDQVLVYMGSFFYFSGLRAALKEFAKLVDNDRNFKFLLIGGGEQDFELKKLVQNLGVQNQVVFTGFIEYRELPNYLKVADVAVSTLEPTLVANVALPNKVLQYLACGLPVVSTKLDGLLSVFESVSAIHWASDAVSVIRMATTLKLEVLSSSAQKSETLSALEKFSPKTSVDSFEKDLLTVAKGAES